MVGLNLLAIKIKSRGAAQSIGMGIGGIGWLLLLVTTDANSNYAGTFVRLALLFDGPASKLECSSASAASSPAHRSPLAGVRPTLAPTRVAPSLSARRACSPTLATSSVSHMPPDRA
jgi:hypothetical protein